MILFYKIEFSLPSTLNRFTIVICIKTTVEGEFVHESVFTLRLLFSSF
jgi:hypothetical protein